MTKWATALATLGIQPLEETESQKNRCDNCSQQLEESLLADLKDFDLTDSYSKYEYESIENQSNYPDFFELSESLDSQDFLGEFTQHQTEEEYINSSDESEETLSLDTVFEKKSLEKNSNFAESCQPDEKSNNSDEGTENYEQITSIVVEDEAEINPVNFSEENNTDETWDNFADGIQSEENISNLQEENSNFSDNYGSEFNESNLESEIETNDLVTTTTYQKSQWDNFPDLNQSTDSDSTDNCSNYQGDEDNETWDNFSSFSSFYSTDDCSNYQGNEYQENWDNFSSFYSTEEIENKDNLSEFYLAEEIEKKDNFEDDCQPENYQNYDYQELEFNVPDSYPNYTSNWDEFYCENSDYELDNNWDSFSDNSQPWGVTTDSDFDSNSTFNEQLWNQIETDDQIASDIFFVACRCGCGTGCPGE